MAYALLHADVRPISTIVLACTALARLAVAASVPSACSPEDMVASDAPPVAVEKIMLVRDPVPAVLLQLSTPSEAVARTLDASGRTPRRIYVDVPNATLAHDVARVIPGVNPIVRVRTGQFGATARVVIETSRTVPYAVGIFDRMITIALDQPGKLDTARAPTPAPAPQEPDRDTSPDAIAAQACGADVVASTVPAWVAVAAPADANQPAPTVTPFPPAPLVTRLDPFPDACDVESGDTPNPLPAATPPPPPAKAASRPRSAHVVRPQVAHAPAKPAVAAAGTTPKQVAATATPRTKPAQAATTATAAAPTAASPVAKTETPTAIATASAAEPKTETPVAPLRGGEHPAAAREVVPAAAVEHSATPPAEALPAAPAANERPVAVVAPAGGLDAALQALGTANDPLLRRAASVLGRTGSVRGVSGSR